MKKFRLKGIIAPGRIHHQKYGIINLYDVSDAIAEELWKEGVPYIEPTAEGRKMMFPREKEIKNGPVPVIKVKRTKKR